MMKIVLRIIKISLLIFVILISFTENKNFESKVINDNLNASVNLSKMALKISEFNYDRLYATKDTFTGDLTAYVYNCPACNGHLGCNRFYDISHTNTYQDKDYGLVNIVASSSNLACGSIIKFTLADTPITAIVLDRGVPGNDIDLLSESLDSARQIGRKTITYDVLRNGYELESNEG